MTNIAYLLGYDGIAFNSMTRQFQPINRAAAYVKKNRIHVNKILPAIQNRLARLCKNPPAYDVMPESNSSDDKEAARLGLQVLEGMWRKLSLDKKRIFLYMWVQQCGHAWLKISWDECLGNLMPNFEDEEGPSEYEGDVRCDVFSPFEIFPDPLAKCDDDVYESWLCTAKVRKLDYFKRYPQGHLVKEEQAWLLSAQYEQRINSLNSRGPTASGLQDSMKGSAIELCKYEARSDEYPEGRMIITANGILLADKPLPVGIIPFCKFDDTLIGGKFYSETPITHARPIQDQYNETIRRRAEWTRKLLAGKYTSPRGSGIASESMNDESGEIVYWDPVPTAQGQGKPEALEVPMMPEWAYTEENNLNLMLNEIFGLSDVSKGILPSSSIPAIGMQLLTEQDDTRIGVITEQHEHAWARAGSLILKYIEMGYVTPRKLKLAGPEMAYAVKEVLGTDIKGNTDVRVIRGSTVPGSKTLARQDIINAYGLGLLGAKDDPAVIMKVLDMIEFGDTGGIWEDSALDNAQIKRGIESLESGIPVQVHEFDNHTAWLMKLNRVRKSDKWGSYPPEIQSLFEATMEQSLGTIVMQNSPPVIPGLGIGPVVTPTPTPGAPGAPQPQSPVPTMRRPPMRQAPKPMMGPQAAPAPNPLPGPGGAA